MKQILSLIVFLILTTKAQAISFEKDIKPIFKNKCSACHNENWPEKNWTNYETAATNSNKIMKVLLNQSMPPLTITKLNEVERLAIYVWIKQGTAP